ncbi:MAG: T9SS type A sorting domain-containing protein [Cyclobacteriaceae bacterium]
MDLYLKIGVKASLAVNQLKLGVFAICLLALFAKSNAQTTYFSRASGAWNSSSTWSTVAFDNPTNTGSFPGAGDIALIGGIGYTISVTANASCSTVTINDNSNLIIEGVTFTVTGNTTVGSGTSGSLSINGAKGNKTFMGLITINPGGVWSNNVNEKIVCRGGITNNGTFAGSGNYYFEVNNQTLTGNFSMPTVTVAGAGVVLTNSSNLTVTSILQGSGQLAQASNATLNLAGSSTISALVATASGNAVNYSGSGQTIVGIDYYHLSLSGSGVKSLQSGTTSISGNLTLSGSASTTAVTGLTIGGSLNIGSGTSFTAGSFSHSIGGNWLNSGSFSGTGSTIVLNGSGQNITGNSISINTLQLSGSGTKAINVDAAVGGLFSVDNGVIAGLNNTNTYTANSLTLGGAIQGAGSWGSTSSAASNKNDTFFSGTGLLTIATGASTYYSIASTDWSLPSTWSTTGFGGLPAVTTPGVSDFVAIGGGRTVTVSTAVTCAALLFDAGTSVTNTLSISSGSLTVNGTITIPQAVTSGANILSVGAGNLVAGSLDFTASGSGAGHQLTISTGTAAIVGDVTGIGPSSTISFSGAGLLQLGGAMFTSSNGTLSAVSGSTVEYNGVTQTVQALNYNNLTLSGGGNKTLASSTTVGANLNVGVGTIFTISGLTVNGSSTINGTLSFSGGSKIFNGLVTINGTWDNSINENVTIRGGVTNNGSFIAGTGTYTFDTNSQALTGTFSIPTVIVVGSSVNLTNNNNLTISTQLGGGGNLVQASNSVLNIGGVSGVNMLATANGNTVNFTGASQTVSNNDYHNLTLSGSGVKTFQLGTSSIGGNLTLSGTISTSAVKGLTIGGSIVIASGTTFTAGAFTHNIGGNWTKNGTFNSAGSTINFNGSAQNLNGGSTTFNDLQLGGSNIKTIGMSTSVTGTLSIDNGVVTNLTNTNIYSSNSLVLGGAIQGAGTWGSTSSTASNQNDTFFSGNGFITVTTGASTYYSIASTDWSLPTTWSTTGFGGAPAASIPGAGDFVAIGGGRTVTVSTAVNCMALFFDAGTSITNTLAISSGSLAVSGAITIPQTVTSGSNVLNVGAGALTAGSLDFTSTTSGAGHQLIISSGTATINGNVTGIGASSTISFSGAGLLRLGGSIFTSSTGTLATASGSTVEYNGGSQTIQALSYDNLTLSGSGNKTLAATTTIGGNLLIGNGSTFVVGGVTLVVVGNSVVNGTLSITSNAGNKTFTGLVTVNNTWINSVNETVNFRGGITNNGTFTAGSGTYNFNTNSQTLTGTFVIPTVVVAGGAVVLTNSNSLTVSNSLGGSGRLSQAPNAILDIGGSSTIGTITATAAGNQVSYTGTAQTIHSNDYHHLTLSGSGVKTLQAGTNLINGNLLLSGTATTTAVKGLTIGGSITIAAGTSFTAGAFTHNVAGDWSNSGTFTGTGSTINFNGGAQNIIGTSTAFNNLQLSGSGVKSLQAGITSIGGSLTLSGTASTVAANGLSIGGSVDIGLGTSFTAGAFTHNVGGNWTNNGLFDATGSTINFNGPSGQNISGSATFNNLTINSAGTVALMSAQNLVGNLSLGATASFNAGAGLLTLISSSDTQTASIGEIQSGATFNGSIIAQRFMGSEGSVNRYVSSPVTGATLADLISNFAIVNNRAQTYVEPAVGTINNGYVNVAPSAILTSGKGYLIKPTAAFAGSDITWDVSGALTIGANQKDVDLVPTYTDTGFDDDGWNLVGNPYPSAIVWDGNPANWDIQDIEPIVYVPDIANPSFYMSYDYSTGLGVPGLGTLNGGVIALGQAFWVRAQGPGLNPTLIVHESAKTSSSGEFYRKKPLENIGIAVTLSDDAGKDVSWLMTKPDALIGYDSRYDRSKLEAPALSVAFLADGKRLTNSTVPSISVGAMFPLYVYTRDKGEFILNFEQVGQLQEFDELILIDNATGGVHRLSEGDYHFMAEAGVRTTDRFSISWGSDNISSLVGISIFPNPVTDFLTVEVSTSEVAMATIVNSLGANLSSGEMTVSSGGSKKSIQFDVSALKPGIYFVKTLIGSNIRTHKFLKK